MLRPSRVRPGISCQPARRSWSRSPPVLSPSSGWTRSAGRAGSASLPRPGRPRRTYPRRLCPPGLRSTRPAAYGCCGGPALPRGSFAATAGQRERRSGSTARLISISTRTGRWSSPGPPVATCWCSPSATPRPGRSQPPSRSPARALTAVGSAGPLTAGSASGRAVGSASPAGTGCATRITGSPRASRLTATPHDRSGEGSSWKRAYRRALAWRSGTRRWTNCQRSPPSMAPAPAAHRLRRRPRWTPTWTALSRSIAARPDGNCPGRRCRVVTVTRSMRVLCSAGPGATCSYGCTCPARRRRLPGSVPRESNATATTCSDGFRVSIAKIPWPSRCCAATSRSSTGCCERSNGGPSSATASSTRGGRRRSCCPGSLRSSASCSTTGGVSGLAGKCSPRRSACSVAGGPCAA